MKEPYILDFTIGKTRRKKNEEKVEVKFDGSVILYFDVTIFQFGFDFYLKSLFSYQVWCKFV